MASRLFEIDYSGLQQPTAVSRVELWGSRDGGRTWENYGVDPDGLSPMIARVPEEGTYGFKFVFHPVHGPAARPPWPGDAPDITIRVDLTRPQARLLGVERNRHDARRITIRWQASDSQLADMPISLYYADMARSQWRPIATNLRNVGSYEWTLPPNLPEQIQIRLDVEDVAGNLTTAETRTGFLPPPVRKSAQVPRGSRSRSTTCGQRAAAGRRGNGPPLSGPHVVNRPRQWIGWPVGYTAIAVSMLRPAAAGSFMAKTVHAVAYLAAPAKTRPRP